MPKLVIVENAEPFTRSTCNCNFCITTHNAVEEWETFVPETAVQYGAIEVVKNIMERENNKQPLRRSPRLAAQLAGHNVISYSL